MRTLQLFFYLLWITSLVKLPESSAGGTGFPLTYKFAFRKDEWEGDNKMGGILRQIDRQIILFSLSDMLSYKTIFDGRAIHTSLIHKSNNIYIFTWLKHLKLVKAYTCKLKLTISFGYNDIRSISHIMWMLVGPGWSQLCLFNTQRILQTKSFGSNWSKGRA